MPLRSVAVTIYATTCRLRSDQDTGHWNIGGLAQNALLSLGDAADQAGSVTITAGSIALPDHKSFFVSTRYAPTSQMQ